jgi:hypothetical protein
MWWTVFRKTLRTPVSMKRWNQLEARAAPHSNLSDSGFECGWQHPFAFLTGVSAAAQYTHVAAGSLGLL